MWSNDRRNKQLLSSRIKTLSPFCEAPKNRRMDQEKCKLDSSSIKLPSSPTLLKTDLKSPYIYNIL